MFHDMLPATEPAVAYKMDQPVETRNGLGRSAGGRFESGDGRVLIRWPRLADRDDFNAGLVFVSKV